MLVVALGARQRARELRGRLIELALQQALAVEQRRLDALTQVHSRIDQRFEQDAGTGALADLSAAAA